MHVVSKKDLNSAELETMRISKNPTTVMTANGEALTREEATVHVKELDLFVTVLLLEETPAVLSLGNSARIMGFLTIGPAVRNHISSETARNSIAIWRTTYHSLSLACRRVPLLHIHLLLQHLHRRILCTENPAIERSGSMGAELLGNPLQEPAETENTNKKEEETKNYEVNYCKMCRYGYRIPKRIWWIIMFNHINTLSALLMNHQCSREQKWYRARVSTAFILTSRKTEITRSA